MKRLILFLCIIASLTSMALAAGAYDLKEMTPAVKTALEARKARYSELKGYKKQGAVGETNRGYVKAMNGAAAVKQIVDQENADRQVIYKAIVEQNGLGGNDLATVEKAFAQVQRDKADSGEKIQDESGSWGAK